MIKLICHFKRKPGMTLEQFKDRYENGHIPLVMSFGVPLADYRRNYRLEDGAFDPFSEGEKVEPDFDVVTEVWYRTREDLDSALALFSRPDIAPIVIADEECFMDRSASRMMLFDEVISDPADLAKSASNPQR